MSSTTRCAIVSTSAALSWPWFCVPDPVSGSNRREDDAVCVVFADRLESGGERGGERLMVS